MNSFVTGDDSCHVSHLLQTDSKEISADLLKRKCIHLQLYEYMYHTAAARAGLRESLRETNTKRLAPISPMSPTSAAGNSKRPASTAHTAPRAAAADRGAVEHLCQQPPLASNPGTTVPGTMGFALGLSLATAADTAAHALNDEQCPVTKPHQGPDPITNTKPHQGPDPITTVTKPHQGPEYLKWSARDVTPPTLVRTGA